MRPPKISKKVIPLKDIPYPDLCKKLKQQMVVQDKTIQDLENVTGYTRTQITLILNEKSKNPNINTLTAIAKALHYSLLYTLDPG